MAKQTDFDRINRIVVQPLTTFYGAKFSDPFIDALVEDLSRYSDATLSAAVLEVRRTCKTTPRIAHLVEACRAAAGTSAHDTANTKDFIAGLRKREEDARRMAAEFMDQFAMTGEAHRAREEGWERHLIAYAQEAAWVQAQYICKVPNPGFSATQITGRCSAKNGEEYKQRCRDFVSSCKRQGATGIIDVSVPSHLIDEWKGAATPMEAA